MSPQIHPSGFRISDKPVAASFAHPYSFQPVSDYMLRDETAIPSSLNLGGVENTFVKYWDESATVAVLEFKVDEPAAPQVSAEAAVVAKEKEKRKKAKGMSTTFYVCHNGLTYSRRSNEETTGTIRVTCL